MRVPSIEEVRAFVAGAHAGQIDKAGRPYVEHVYGVADAVAAAGHPDHYVMAALLHDALEDTCAKVDDLVRFGVPQDVIDAVVVLTKPRSQSADPDVKRAHYVEFVMRTKTNPMARVVKKADLTNNLDPDRLSALPAEKSAELRAKYEGMLELLDRDD